MKEAGIQEEAGLKNAAQKKKQATIIQ